VPGHDHWHLRNFEIYELRRASDYRLLTRDRKVGFCLTSDIRAADARPALVRRAMLASARAAQNLITRRDLTPACGRRKSKLLRVVEAIDPGTGDVYERYLPGQYVDVTNAPNGRYVLVVRVNPFRRIAESDYTNNSASLLLALHRSRPGARPKVTVLQSCFGTDHCPAG
jgi:hypothetical protein